MTKPGRRIAYSHVGSAISVRFALVALKRVRSSVAAPGIEICTSRMGRPQPRIARSTADENRRARQRRRRRAILQQPYAIDDDIKCMIGDQPPPRGRIQPSSGSSRSSALSSATENRVRPRSPQGRANADRR